MRALLAAVLAVSLTAPALSVERPDNATDALRAEALQNAGRDNWKGHHHYLYDDEYQPETTGTAPGVKQCSDEIVRMQRSDGKTTIKRIDRCD
jgi:hypothetical protein